jgi:hypothetical protein
MTEATRALVARYGGRAYHAAVGLTARAVRANAMPAAEKYAACARELLEAGYHKHARPDRPHQHGG